MISWFSTWVYKVISVYFDYTFNAIADPITNTSIKVALIEATTGLLKTTVPFIAGAAVVGTVVEFFQVGVVLAPKRLMPKLEHLNPVDGLKKIFSKENFIEVLKSILKTVVLFMIFIVVLKAFAYDYMILPMGSTQAMIATYWQGLRMLLITVIGVFLFIAILDVVYQRHVFIKNMMMSLRDIKQEMKDSEGDPMLKGQRKQLHQEWSQQNSFEAVRQADAVVVNPTHIAVALYYDADETGIPLVVAKGEGYMAQQIREVAEEAGVPILQNIDLARGLYREIQENTYITPDYFEAVAEVLKWAEETREENKYIPRV